MASRHQWKKYNINYVNNWSESFTPHKASYDDDYILVTAEKDYSRDCMVYLGYRIEENGDFTLTRPKRAEEVRKNDVVYGYIHERVSYPYYATYPEYEQYGNEKKNEIGKFTIKDPGYAESTPWQDDGAKLKYWYQYGSGRAYLEGNIKSVLRSTSANRGSYVGTVQGQGGEYPQNGQQDGFWYVYDRALNQAPTISGSSTRLGAVRSDFDIRYTVYDSDGDRVRVQVMVDDRVIQYPMDTELNREQVVRIRLNDYSLGEHTVTVTATDSSNASATRTYYFTKSNQAPTISGSDLDLGGVYKDVSVDYIVQDADGDSVEVKISLDGAIKQAFTKTTLGVRRTFTLPIRSVELGRHRLEIEARDSQGASSLRVYTFEKVNSAPTISGTDINLGAKNTAFSYKYSVKDNEGDNVKVVEKLNGSIIRTLYNVTLGQEQTITISDEQIKKMELHKQNTIEIEASDGTATVYRRVNFTRNNMPPIISDVDKDLGILTDKLEYKFSATDPEEDKMVYTVSLDDRILTDREPIADGREKSILIEGMDWIKLRPTKHTIKIIVEDDKGFKSTRKITFTRRVDRIIVQLAKKGIATDAIASRVLISDAGIYSARGAITKLEVCNNSFDDKPTWEDATTMFKAGRAFKFQNKSKTATKAGVNIRVTIGKGESTAPSYITATGGSFD